MNYKIEYSEISATLTIFHNARTNSGVIFVAFMACFFVLCPILVLIFFTKILVFGSVIICFVSWLFAWYFIRLYLWNKYGKEVYCVKKNQFTSYFDYKLYKDNLTTYTYSTLNLFYMIDDDKMIKIKNNTKIEIFKHKESVVCFNVDNHQIITLGKISVDAIKELNKYIVGWLYPARATL